MLFSLISLILFQLFWKALQIRYSNSFSFCNKCRTFNEQKQNDFHLNVVHLSLFTFEKWTKTGNRTKIIIIIVVVVAVILDNVYPYAVSSIHRCVLSINFINGYVSAWFPYTSVNRLINYFIKKDYNETVFVGKAEGMTKTNKVLFDLIKCCILSMKIGTMVAEN